MTELPEHAIRNRELWTRSNAEYTDPNAPASWAQEEIPWGMFKVPENTTVRFYTIAGRAMFGHDALNIVSGTLDPRSEQVFEAGPHVRVVVHHHHHPPAHACLLVCCRRKHSGKRGTARRQGHY